MPAAESAIADLTGAIIKVIEIEMDARKAEAEKATRSRIEGLESLSKNQLRKNGFTDQDIKRIPSHTPLGKTHPRYHIKDVEDYLEKSKLIQPIICTHAP